MEYNLQKHKTPLNHYAVPLKLIKYCKSTVLQLKNKTTVAYCTFGVLWSLVDFHILCFKITVR